MLLLVLAAVVVCVSCELVDQGDGDGRSSRIVLLLSEMAEIRRKGGKGDEEEDPVIVKKVVVGVNRGWV